jgi:hypothetical protein
VLARWNTIEGEREALRSKWFASWPVKDLITLN